MSNFSSFKVIRKYRNIFKKLRNKTFFNIFKENEFITNDCKVLVKKSENFR